MTQSAEASPMGASFARRTISLFRFLGRLGHLLVLLPRILALHLGSRRMRPPLREALWLAVTEVNGCRYCAYIHAGTAGLAGLSQEDIDLLLASSSPEELTGLSPEERETVAFAKVWADTAGHPPQGARDGLSRGLSPKAMADLDALLLTIDFANRSGNTLDSLLHRLGHGRRLLDLWGLVNDLVVGLLVALFGWPALPLGALARWRSRRLARAAAR